MFLYEGAQYVIGEPHIPPEDRQRKIKQMKLECRQGRSGPLPTEPGTDNVEEPIDLQEKYLQAMEQLWKRGQTPQMLLRILQGKVSERMGSYADQVVRVRKLFESYSDNRSGGLDVYGFRKCLELIGCQLDEVQSLALYAYFDENNDGTVSWTEIADQAMIHNPKSGKLLPKQITATLFSEDWSSLAVNMYH